MNFKHIYILFFLSLFFFIPIFLRIVPAISPDSFYFLNSIFGKTILLDGLTLPLGKFIFSLIPANIFVIKLIQLIVTTISLIIFYFVGEKVSKGVGLIASFLLISSLFFSKIFIRLEDDLFALPFLFLSLYFLISTVEKEKLPFFDRNIILSLLFLFIACNIWGFSVFFIPLFLIISKYHKLYILAQVPFIIFLPKIIGLILPSFKVSENLPFIGILPISIFAYVFLKKYRYKPLFLVIIISSILTIINFKFLFIAIPFLCLATGYFFIKSNIKAQQIIIIIFSILFIFSLYSNYISYPNNKDINLLFEVVKIADELNTTYTISWSVGYIAEWYGFESKGKGAYTSYTPEGIVLTTNNDKLVKDCNIINKSKILQLVKC